MRGLARAVGRVAWSVEEAPEEQAGVAFWAGVRAEGKRRRRGNLHPSWVGEKACPKEETVAATVTAAKTAVEAEAEEATGEGKKGAAAWAAARVMARVAARAAERVAARVAARAGKA